MISRMLEKRRASLVAGATDASVAQEGFTLIELMVVLLIMGILMAIAIPTFLGVTGSAKDKGAQSDLTSAMTNAEGFYTNAQSYSGLTAGYLNSVDPGVHYTLGATSANESQNQVDFFVGTGGNSIEVATWSPAGMCWYEVNDQIVHATTTGYFGGASGSSFAMVVSKTADCPSLITTATTSPAPPSSTTTANDSIWYSSWPPAPNGK
ncbi:MAG: type IV pilin protein [Acidimicrobiales bacterium]